MKIKIVFIILVCIFAPLTLVSDTQKRIKVHVYVDEDPNTDVDDRLEAFLKREFRALGDVDIVNDEHSDWDYLCDYNFGENKFKDGSKTGHLSIASAVLMSVPKHLVTFDTTNRGIHTKPVFFQNLYTASWQTDNLHEYAIQSVASIDKTDFELWREINK